MFTSTNSSDYQKRNSTHPDYSAKDDRVMAKGDTSRFDAGLKWEEQFATLIKKFNGNMYDWVGNPEKGNIRTTKSDIEEVRYNGELYQDEIPLPDFYLLNGEWHEIRHKYPSREGWISISTARYRHLMYLVKRYGDRHRFFYTIRKESNKALDEITDIDHWRCIEISDIFKVKHPEVYFREKDHVDKRKQPNYLIPFNAFKPLRILWGLLNIPDKENFTRLEPVPCVSHWRR